MSEREPIKAIILREGTITPGDFVGIRESSGGYFLFVVRVGDQELLQPPGTNVLIPLTQILSEGLWEQSSRRRFGPPKRYRRVA